MYTATVFSLICSCVYFHFSYGQTVLCPDYGDPCDPSYPCLSKDRIADPYNCKAAKFCLAPYQWQSISGYCEDQDYFTNITCICSDVIGCIVWDCPPPVPPQIPNPKPCYQNIVGEDYPCTDGVSIPDQFVCSKFHRCQNSRWMVEDCPPETPYYDIARAYETNPCSNAYETCYKTQYDGCIPKIIPTVPVTGTTGVEQTTTTTTTAAPTTTTTTIPEPTTVGKEPSNATLNSTEAVEITTIGLDVSTSNLTDVLDACDPATPCESRTRISYPADCEKFQECIAPQEWVVDDTECGSGKGNFNNLTQDCSPIYSCQTWTCPPDASPPPPVQPAPCITPSTSCNEGYPIPDKYYCTSYHRCEGGMFQHYKCPQAQPYFNVDLMNDPDAEPCTNNIVKCHYISFNDCQ